MYVLQKKAAQAGCNTTNTAGTPLPKFQNVNFQEWKSKKVFLPPSSPLLPTLSFSPTSLPSCLLSYFLSSFLPSFLPFFLPSCLSFFLLVVLKYWNLNWGPHICWLVFYHLSHASTTFGFSHFSNRVSYFPPRRPGLQSSYLYLLHNWDDRYVSPCPSWLRWDLANTVLRLTWNHDPDSWVAQITGVSHFIQAKKLSLYKLNNWILCHFHYFFPMW
jgi:hypothetical protein